MNFIYDTQKALGNLQDRTIGLFMIYGTNNIDLVVEVDKNLLKTVHIGELGGASVIHIPKEKGKLIMFDEGVTLGSIKGDNPFKLREICEELKKH